MRILLDESLPRQRARLPHEHEVRTLARMGWSGTRNGPLLDLAAADFDVFLTADQNLEHQQNLRALPIAVAVLVAASKRIKSLRPLVPTLLRVLPTLKRGDLVRLAGQRPRDEPPGQL